MHPLAACPFCDPRETGGSDPGLRETNRDDKVKFDKHGRRRNRVSISHIVECGNCGAQGPPTMPSIYDDLALTEEMIEHSIAAAALAWNTRQPINDRAYELVNRLITEALRQIE